MLRREAGAADPQAAAAGGLEQLAGGAPSARGSSGFLKVEPKVLIPDGWASRRLLRISASVALTVGRIGRRERERAPGDDLAVAEVRARGSEKPSWSGVRRSDPAAVQTVDPLEHRAELAAVGVRVHPHRAADGAGDVDAELEPGEPPAGRLAAAEGSRAPPPQSSRVAVALDPREVAVELEHQASKAIVRDEQVRSRADHSYREPRRSGPGEQLDQRAPRSPARAKKSAGPPARTVVSRASG